VLSTTAAAQLEDAPGSQGPVNVDVGTDSVDLLIKLLNGELQRHRAIVHIDNLRTQSKEQAGEPAKIPLVEQLHEYPVSGIDLSNIVEFPPKLALIPVKPIFLDVAWNYIQYPGRTTSSPAQEPSTSGKAEPAGEPPKQQKKGWFGFGR
jgi:signal recognition particle subunit SRP68